MNKLLRFSVSLLLVLMLTACGDVQEGDRAARTASGAGHFTLTLSGPGFDGEKQLSIPADQIGGIIYDSSLLWLYQRKQDADSAIFGMTMEVSRPNLSPGVYDFDDQNVSMTFTLDDKDGRSISMEAESGTVTLTSYSESEKKAAGSLDAQFRSTNYKDQVYTVKGSFSVIK